MSEKKLLPCPFCGEEAKRAVIFGRNGIECRKCLCMMRGWLDATPEEIAEQWNTRVPMERIVERLEEEYKDVQMEYSEAKYQLMEMSEKDSGYISQNYRKDMNEGMCFAFDDAIDIVKEEGGLND